MMNWPVPKEPVLEKLVQVGVIGIIMAHDRKGHDELIKKPVPVPKEPVLEKLVQVGVIMAHDN